MSVLRAGMSCMLSLLFVGLLAFPAHAADSDGPPAVVCPTCVAPAANETSILGPDSELLRPGGGRDSTGPSDDESPGGIAGGVPSRSEDDGQQDEAKEGPRDAESRVRAPGSIVGSDVPLTGPSRPGSYRLPDSLTEAPAASSDGDLSLSESLFTGELAEGEYNVENVKIPYHDSETNLWGVLTNPRESAMDGPVGWTSNFLFAGYKWTIYGGLSVIGSVAFGMHFAQAGLEPALITAEKFQDQLFNPAGLFMLAMAITALYAAYLFAQRRGSDLLANLALTAIVVSLFAVIPAQGIRWFISLTATLPLGVFVAFTGGDPNSVPAPSSKPINSDALLKAYGSVTGGLEERMIGRVAEVLTFGTQLPEDCRAAYLEGLALGLPANDDRNLKAMAETPGCEAYVQYAAQNPGDTVWWGLVLLVIAVCFLIAMALMAVPAVLGQAVLIVGVALISFVALALALPGSWRAGAARMMMNLMLAGLALSAFAVLLVAMIGLMSALLDGAVGLPILWVLVVIVLCPVSILWLHVLYRRRQRRAVARAARRMGHREAPGDRRAERMERAVVSRARQGVRATRQVTVRAAKAGVAFAAGGAGAVPGVLWGRPRAGGVKGGSRGGPSRTQVSRRRYDFKGARFSGASDKGPSGPEKGSVGVPKTGTPASPRGRRRAGAVSERRPSTVPSRHGFMANSKDHGKATHPVPKKDPVKPSSSGSSAGSRRTRGSGSQERRRAPQQKAPVGRVQRAYGYAREGLLAKAVAAPVKATGRAYQKRSAAQEYRAAAERSREAMRAEQARVDAEQRRARRDAARSGAARNR